MVKNDKKGPLINTHPFIAIVLIIICILVGAWLAKDGVEKIKEKTAYDYGYNEAYKERYKSTYQK